MGAILDALHRLHAIETQVRSVREQIESKKRTLHGHQRKLATLERQIADTHLQIKQAQADADRLDLDRKSHEQHIAKLRETLNRTKTNKEYAAILTQLNTDKADSAKLDETVLVAMAKVDDLRKQEGDLKASLEKEKARGVELQKAADDASAKYSSKLKDLEAQRDEAAKDVPREAYATFQRACEAHEGEGMAAVEQVHPKRPEFICGGCNMSLTLENVNSLQTRDVVVQCPNCYRILYLDVARVNA